LCIWFEVLSPYPLCVCIFFYQIWRSYNDSVLLNSVLFWSFLHSSGVSMRDFIHTLRKGGTYTPFVQFSCCGVKPQLVLYVKCPIFWPDFNEIWNFSTKFHESLQYQISRKSVQWEPRWMCGRTDRRAVRHAFRDCLNAPQIACNVMCETVNSR
jgi:hypothetical protein